MRLGRLACGVIAGIVGIVSAVAVQAIETRVLGETTGRSFWVTFFAVGGAVLWLADHFELLAAPYTERSLDLRGTENSDCNWDDAEGNEPRSL
jgi:hypothetical protein